MVARAKIKEINKLLPLGWPYNVDFDLDIKPMTVIEALNKGWSFKMKVLRQESINSYTSRINHLQKYLVHNKLDDLSIDEFVKAQAFVYMDSYRGIANSTYNNYLLYIHGIFQELKDRKLITQNPFSGIPKKKESQKIRLGLTKHQSDTIMSAVKENDKTLFLAILLLKYCFLRPNEMRKLRKSDFDLDKGCIYIASNQAKNDNAALITIPVQLLPILKEYGIDTGNKSHLIFRSKADPHKAIGKNALNIAHKKILDQLMDKKLLSSITGISIYSWKDTGGAMLIEDGLDIITIKEHMRHKDIATTQRYVQQRSELSDKIKNIKVVY